MSLFRLGPSALLSSILFLLPAGSIRAGQAGIPFEFRDGLIWVKVATEEGGAPLHFLLDSGAGRSVLDLGAARRLGVKLGSRVSVARVGESADAFEASSFDGKLGGIPLPARPLVLDLSETSAECSRAIDGLIGQDFFRGRVVEIDFKARRIRLPERADPARACSVLPLKLVRDVMCVPVSVEGGRPRWTRLDTGCDGGLHWVTGDRSGRDILSIRLGSENLPGVRTFLHADPIFPSEAGLLGNGVLSRYTVTIDGVGRRLLLEEPS